MASTRDIKNRIESIKSTGQITKAMKLVSSSKLQKSKEKAENNRLFAAKIKELISDVTASKNDLLNVYTANHNNGKNVYIVVSSDRGLCGGYNINLFRYILNNINKEKENQFITIGKKAREFFRKSKFELREWFSGISEKPDYEHAKIIAEKVIKLYENKEVEAVYLVYTEFKSVITQNPQITKLLPLEAKNIKKSDEINKKVSLLKYEPSEETVLKNIVPKYITSMIYNGLLESAASEQGARMTAMDSSTKNANELIGKLTLKYNRVRQASITQELSEIVGGSNAQKYN